METNHIDTTQLSDTNDDNHENMYVEEEGIHNSSSFVDETIAITDDNTSEDMLLNELYTEIEGMEYIQYTLETEIQEKTLRIQQLRSKQQQNDILLPAAVMMKEEENVVANANIDDAAMIVEEEESEDPFVAMYQTALRTRNQFQERIHFLKTKKLAPLNQYLTMLSKQQTEYRDTKHQWRYQPYRNRIQSEWKQILLDPTPDIEILLPCEFDPKSVQNDTDDELPLTVFMTDLPSHWHAHLKGPKDSVYEKGIFTLDIHIPNDYPYKPPHICFLTPIYHCNIANDHTGIVCLDLLASQWSPAMTIAKTLLAIQSMLTSPDIEDALNPVMAVQYQLDRIEFDRIATEWTQLYASSEQAEIVYTTNHEQERTLKRQLAIAAMTTATESQATDLLKD